MKKIIILIPLILAVFGVWYAVKSSGINNNEVKSEVKAWVQQADEFCKDVKISTHGSDQASCKGRDFVIANKALTDQEYCEHVNLVPEADGRFREQTNRILCKNAIAINAADPMMCVGMNSSDSSQKESYNSCVYIIVGNSKNIESCEITSLFPTTETKENCYSGVASASKKIELCDKIADDVRKSRCYYDFYQEYGPSAPADCAKMPAKDIRFRCYATVAIKLRDKAICQNIDSKYMASELPYDYDPKTMTLQQMCLTVADKNFGKQ